MANNENTRAPAGGSEQTALQQLRAIWNELDLGKSTSRDPRITDSPVPVPREWFTRMAKVIGALASAPASAPLPLTDERIDALWERHVVRRPRGRGVRYATHFFARAVESECLAAAPVADERASFEAWWPTDPVARAHADNSRDLALIEHGWHGRAALSGGSPEPVSGSEAIDAKRYRWLRDHAGHYESGIYEDNGFGGQSLKYAEDLDGAIDAALSTERASERGQA